MLNSIGLQNPGVDVVAHEYAPRWREWTIRVIVNVAGGSIDEYVHCARVLEPVAEVAGIELNISCPNIAGGLDFGRDPVAAGKLVAAVRAVTRALHHREAEPERHRHRRGRSRCRGSRAPTRCPP